MANLKNVKTYISKDKQTTVYVGFDTVEDGYVIQIHSEKRLLNLNFGLNKDRRDDYFEALKTGEKLEEVKK